MNLANFANSKVMLLLILMLPAWGLLAFDLYQIVSQPALSGEARYSRGWEILWAFALVLLTWLFMGLLLYRQHTPGGLLISFLSGVAAVCGLLLIDNGKSKWPALLVLLLPLAITGAALTRYWPAVRIWLIVISLIPCVLSAGSIFMAMLGTISGHHTLDKQTRQKNLAIVRTISEDQPLWTWLPLVTEESGVRREALLAMRRLKRRQSDIEQMLAQDGIGLDLVPELDLQLTPRLQQLINSLAVKDATYARTMPGGGNEILERSFIYSSVPAMHWLRRHGGDCHQGTTELRSAVLLYRDTPVRRKLLQELDTLSADPR